MDVAIVPLLFLVVPVAVVLAAVFGLPALIERRRQKAYAAFCFSRGYQYVPSREDATTRYLEIVDMFKTGLKRSWRDEISGQFNSKPFTAFEYQYVTGWGRERMVFNRAVVHWDVDRTTLPAFNLVPAKTYLFRIGRQADDVDFPDDPAFSRAYGLKGADQATIKGLFTPAVRASMTALPGQFLAGKGADLFWWREGRLPPPDGIDAFLSDADRIRDVIVNA